MKIVLDTNVFVSGIFWFGPPYQILEAWQTRKIKLAITEEILEEYNRVANILAKKYPPVDISPIIDLVTSHAEMYYTTRLPVSVSIDPDDDKFINCAISAKAKYIISGDAHLFKISEYKGIKILKPREFVEIYLNKKS
jgi:putative PIN family toxin of toxin-antitoxin system